MTRRRTYPPTVHLQAFQRDNQVVLDWFEYRSADTSGVKKPYRHRRVFIRTGETYDAAQLTVLLSRMAAYVLAHSGPMKAVRRSLPWMEVGATQWSAPPEGVTGGKPPTGPTSVPV